MTMTRIRKIIRRAAARAATRAPLPTTVRTYMLWTLGYPPIAGAEGEGGGDGGTGGGSGDGGGSGGDGGAGGGDGGGSGDEWTPPDKAAWDNVNRQAREAREEADRLKREQQERERKAAEDAGNHQAIAEQERRQREEAEARAKAAEEERDRIREENERSTKRSRAERIAGRLNFLDPEDVLHRLSDDQLSSDAKCENALKKLAEQKPYLVRDGTKRNQGNLDGGAGGGNGGGTGGAGGDAPERAGVHRLEDAYAESANKD